MEYHPSTSSEHYLEENLYGEEKKAYVILAGKHFEKRQFVGLRNSEQCIRFRDRWKMLEIATDSVGLLEGSCIRLLSS
jgi:hypothetical protein